MIGADDATNRDTTGVETNVHEPGITFSIIVTFYNQREFVADALESLLGQRQGVEIIAVDDGSSDGTADALLEYDDVIKVVLLDENLGVSGARNSGAAEATGEYLIFLDGDDAFLPWALDVYATIARARRPVAIIGSLQWFSGDLPSPGAAPREVTFIEYPDYFMKDRSLGAHAVATAIDSCSFHEVGGWDPAVRIFEDYDLMWRLGLSGPVIYTIEPATTLHRAHAAQTTQQSAKMLQGAKWAVDMERSGRYPGRGLRALERKACVGGCALQWAIGLRRHSRRQTAKLLLESWPLVLAAVAVRLRALARGRRPVRTIQLATDRGPLRTTD